MKKGMLILPVAIMLILVLSAVVFVFIQALDSSETNNAGSSEAFLWRIKGDNPSYLFGSIHLTGEDLLDLPEEVEDALDEVDYVFTEVKMDYYTTLEASQDSMLESGQTIQDLLPDDVEEKLDNYLQTKGYSIALFSNFKIWSVTSTIPLLDDIVELATSPSLDQYIWNLGEEKDKGMGGLETVDEQIGIFDGLTIDEQILLLNETIDEAVKSYAAGVSLVDTMKEAYLSGDIELLHSMLISDYDESDPLDVKLWSQLITERNEKMVSRIKENITNNPDKQFFFVIGAGHYYGEEGILELLENEGFIIKRV